jgi:gamma-glutamylputrescine oxidase
VGGFTGFSSGMAKVVYWAGRDDARKLFDLVSEAKSIIRERVERHKIDCDLAWGYFHGANKPRQPDGLRRNQDLWARDFAYDDTRMAETREEAVQYVNSPSYIGGLYEGGAGHLHPLNYCLGLARAAAAMGVRIFEGSLVQRIESGARAAVSVRLSLVVLALGLGHLFAGDPAVAVEVEAQETTRALGMELLQRDRAVVVPVEAIEVPRAGGARLYLGNHAVLVRI